MDLALRKRCSIIITDVITTMRVGTITTITCVITTIVDTTTIITGAIITIITAELFGGCRNDFGSLAPARYLGPSV